MMLTAYRGDGFLSVPEDMTCETCNDEPAVIAINDEPLCSSCARRELNLLPGS
jgi:hypothetical protein